MNYPAQAVGRPAEFSSVPQGEEAADQPVVASVLRRWAARGGLMRQIIGNAGAEISRAAQDMEVESGAVIDSFRDVARKAQSQGDRIADLAAKANRVTFDGQELEFNAVAALFDHTLDDIISKIGALTEHAVSMVAVLDGMHHSLAQIENCIGKVDAINRQTKMLAVNARIEAARSGGASGHAFGIVAHEIGQLSETTKALSGTMRQHMGEVIGAIRDSHHVFKKVACVDMSADIAMREQLEKLVGAMIERGTGLGHIVAEAAVDQGKISDQISKIITGMQFQDRVTQRLNQALDTLSTVADGLGSFEQEAFAADPGSDEDGRTENAAWLQEIAERHTLSDMRSRFIAQVIANNGPDPDSDGADAAARPAEAGSVELF